jgi:hypothetical protein
MASSDQAAANTTGISIMFVSTICFLLGAALPIAGVVTLILAH